MLAIPSVPWYSRKLFICFLQIFCPFRIIGEVFSVSFFFEKLVSSQPLCLEKAQVKPCRRGLKGGKSARVQHCRCCWVDQFKKTVSWWLSSFPLFQGNRKKHRTFVQKSKVFWILFSDVFLEIQSQVGQEAVLKLYLGRRILAFAATGF